MLGLFLTGCIGFYVPEGYEEVDTEAVIKEARIQDTIKHYVQGKSPMGYNYKSLEFGDVYVIKDEEIKKLDDLLEQKNYLPFKEDELGADYEKTEKNLQAKIDKQKAYLKENNIYPWYEVNHLYAFEHVISDSAIIHEFDFEVYPNYRVKDVHKKMGVSLDAKQYKFFKHFLNQEPVYKGSDWQWEEEMNSEFYAAAFSALENEEYYKDKLLLTIIDMTGYIKEKNNFDENDFAKIQLLKWEKQFLDVTPKTISISQLKSTIDTLEGNPVLTGYTMNHDFYTESIDDKRRFEFYFDLNYVILRVTEQKVNE